MVRALLVFMACVPCFQFLSPAQYWAPANLPVVVDGQLTQLYSDEAENAFCVCGLTRVPENAPSPWRVGLVCNLGNQWDTLGIFNNTIGPVAKWADTLFVSGGFTGVDWNPLPGRAAIWYDGQWHPDPQFNLPSHAGIIRKTGVAVFILGKFEESPGVDHTGVGIRQGGRWVPVGNLPALSSTSSGPQIFDIIEFNGELVITGNINTVLGDDVLVLDGDDWVPLGGGLVGWNSFGKRMAVYQGELYVGGGMSMAGGDVGQNIVRWDGTQWHPVGSGLQTQLNNFGAYGTAEDMVVHNDELFVCGGFRYAGGIPAKCVARWNGSQWCSVGGDTGDYIFCMGFFQDTLLVNSQTMGHIARFVAPEYEDNCGLWTGVEEHTAETDAIRAWQDAGAIVIEGLPIGTHEVSMHDATGRFVHRARTTSDGTKAYFQRPVVSEGVYFVTAVQLGLAARLHITR
ncbi:MAG: hypothetical protein IPM12_00110 [Flavobacteriales bacterium]|nr:hypothetical protein [Flavobacteriales bacterium]